MAWAWPPVVDDITAIGVTPRSYQASSRSRTSPALPLIVQSSIHSSRHQARQRVAVARGEGLLDGGHLGLVPGGLPVVAVVRQRDVAAERAPVDRPGGVLVGVDHGRRHVREGERVAPVGRDRGQLVGHVRERGVGPDRAVGDLDGEGEHLVAQRRQPDRGQRPRRPLGRADALDVPAHVGERAARRQAQAVHRRGVADTESEPEAPAAHLGEVAGGDRHLGRVAVVDRLDARPERDARRHVGERAAQRQVAVHARAGEPGEAEPVGLGGEARGSSPASSACR